MPGLLLTEAQGARLLGLEPDVCRDVLATLVAEGSWCGLGTGGMRDRARVHDVYEG